MNDHISQIDRENGIIPRRGRRGRRAALLLAALLTAAVAAIARPDSAAAMGYFSDGSYAGAVAGCDGLHWSFQSLGADYVRYFVYDHQQRRYVYTHGWIRAGFVQSGLPWPWGAGRFSIYAQYAKVVGGRWEYAGEFVGTLPWRTDIVYGKLFCWPH